MEILHTPFLMKNMFYHLMLFYVEMMSNIHRTIFDLNVRHETYLRSICVEHSGQLPLGKQAEAQADYAEALRREPEDVQTAWTVAWSHFKETPPTEEDLWQLEQIAVLDLNHYTSHLCYAVIALQDNDLQTAQKCAEQAVNFGISRLFLTLRDKNCQNSAGEHMIELSAQSYASLDALQREKECSMKNPVPGFQEGMRLMRKHDPQLQEDGFHLLFSHAHEYAQLLMNEFAHETDPGLRCWLLELLAEARDLDPLPLFLDSLHSDETSLKTMAVRGLKQLNTNEARRALWQAGAL